MTRLTAALALAISALALPSCAQIPAPAEPISQCGAGTVDVAALKSLKANAFAATPAVPDDTLAMALANCLSDPDPAIRDGIAYEGLTTLLRAQRVPIPAMQALRTDLIAALSPESADPAGVHKPFAALVLSEVIRADRVEAHLTPQERTETLEAAATYLETLTDYRGYDDTEGWRHGVAHTADALMQAALNPNFTADHHRRILDAVAAQVAPDAHAYVFGESERLTRPVLFVANAGTLTDEEWEAWFTALADPAPLESWNDAFTSEAALRRLHNLKAFLNVIYLNASRSQSDGIKPRADNAISVLRELP